MNNLEIVLNPTLEEFAELNSFIEGPFLRDGYYGFISDSIFLVRCGGCIVGYLTYRRNEIWVELQDIFVSPKFRRRGIATFLVDQTLKYFIARGVCVAEIVAVTEEGCAHAKALKFRRMDSWNDWTQEYTRYTKILCPYRKPTKTAKNMLCVWKDERYYDMKPDTKPSVIWSLDKSDLPIIFLCKSPEWIIAVIEDGKTIKEGRIKDLLKTTAKYIRIEIEGTNIQLWTPECMKNTKYSRF